MSSTYSQNLGLELIGDGEQSGIWGDTTNYNLGTLLEQAITGVQAITVGGSDVILSNFQGLSNQARNAVLYVTGTPGAVRTIFIPSGQSKTYIVYNGISGGFSLNVYVTGQTSGVTIPNGATILMYTNGTQSFLVSPTTAANPTVSTFTGYVAGTTLNVTSGTVTSGQVIYNPGFITAANPGGSVTIASGASPTYTITYPPPPAGVPAGTVNIGAVTVAPNQPFVAITTPTQLVTLDYVQNKTQSVTLGGTPTTPTPTASVFEGYVTGSILVVTLLYPNSGGVSPGYFVNGNNITAGSFVQANGTGSTVGSTFTGYISAGAGLTTPGTTLTVISVPSGSLVTGQYIDGANSAIGSTLASGSGLSWTISGSTQLVGSPTNPVTFRGLGAGTGATGWYTLNTPSTNVNITPIVAFLQPAQIANMTLFSYVSYLVGSLGAQDYHNVSIVGGNISGVNLSALTTDLAVTDGGTGAGSQTQNALMIGNGTSAMQSLRPGAAGNVALSTVGATVNASALVEGTQYTIATLGSTVTNWVAIGASVATVGTVFVKNSTAATGDGTATTNVWNSSTISTVTTTVGTAPYYGARAFVQYGGAATQTVTGSYTQAANQTVVNLTINGGTAPSIRTLNPLVGHRMFITFAGAATNPVNQIYSIDTIVTDPLGAIEFTVIATTTSTSVRNGNFTIVISPISSSQNVASVAGTVAGATNFFFINFIVPMSNANYTVVTGGVSTNVLSITAGQIQNQYSFALNSGGVTTTANNFYSATVFQ